MINRPISVSIIAWFLIVSSILSLGIKYFGHGNPMVEELMSKSLLSNSVQDALMYGGAGFTLLAGGAMLRGRHWGRMLYMGWGVFGLVVTLVTSPIKITVVPGAVWLAVIAYFLFRPNANVYFSPRQGAVDA